ncbi:MAG TPA: hypothetical protein VKA46_15795 [Gemmataceae bacterium]|nr:hypothetical protein [Gemmataceae bacterium]
MRLTTHVLLALPLLLAASAAASADDAADKLAAQKKTAEENWDGLGGGGAPAHAETTHLLVYAPKSYEKRLKEIGASLEKSYEQARKPLGYEKEEPWPGKIAVYLLPEREDFVRFVRRVEKRHAEAEDAGSHWIEGDFPHAVGGPPRAKTDPSAEVQAAEQVATALLVKKAGAKVPLPAWLLNGFGRATGYRVRPTDKAVVEERRKTAALVKKGQKAADIWGKTLEADDAPALEASLADFLAYGPGQSKFVALLEAFKPEENQQKKTTKQALDGISLPVDRLNTRWREWAANPK